MGSVLETISRDTTGRIAQRFARLREAGDRALVTYLTAGYPKPADTASLLTVLAESGADVIELGIPFSDPLADGPTIQRASQQAIGAGATLAWALEEVASFRARFETPVVVFSYLNPVIAYGVDRFVRDSVEAGADGVLITDLPPGSDPALERTFQECPLEWIQLLAPTTPAERAADIAARAQGFIYYISRTGVTGARSTLRNEVRPEVEALRPHARVPIVVGFGISSPEQAAEVARVADGVVVGSALIDALDRGGVDAFRALLGSLRSALDGIGPLG